MEDAAEGPAPPPTDRSSAWTWAQLAGMLAWVLLFSGDLGYHFASLQWRRIPAEQRINNGSEPTFFAFHIDPYYNFSEDFHLYYVRAKRIADRGWTDSPLYSHPGEGRNYVAPLQVLLSRIALLTGGRPIPYAAYIFVTLLVGWGVLLVAARAWLPPTIHSGSIVLAVLFTVLVEAIHHTFSAPRLPTFDIWPAFRGLRMATMSWTSPMLTAVMIGLVSLANNPRQRIRTLVALLAMYALLLTTDNWAFGLAWTAAGLTWWWIAAKGALARRQTGAWPGGTIPILVCVASAMVAMFAVHAWLSRPLQGDVLLRSGFGPAWKGVDQYKDLVPTLWLWAAAASIPIVIMVALGKLEVLPAPIRHGLFVRIRPVDGSSFWPDLIALILLPALTTVVLYNVLKFTGAEPFLRYQLYWRGNYCCTLPFALALLEWARTTLDRLDVRAARRWTLVTGLMLAGFFVYHDHRVHKFVKNVARVQFYLTADEEKLRDWLEEFERKHGRFELATLSPELNYLIAYWTDADLLLPSGFPYHNVDSNAEIQRRLMALLRLYNVTPAGWLATTNPSAEGFCELWVKSRVRAQGEGFIYHMFHRMLTLTEPGKERFNELKRIEIGKKLAEPRDAPLPRPDVIIVDPVSRSFGRANVGHYFRALRAGELEAWVRVGSSLPLDDPAPLAGM